MLLVIPLLLLVCRRLQTYWKNQANYQVHYSLFLSKYHLHLKIMTYILWSMYTKLKVRIFVTFCLSLFALNSFAILWACIAYYIFKQDKHNPKDSDIAMNSLKSNLLLLFSPHTKFNMFRSSNFDSYSFIRVIMLNR